MKSFLCHILLAVSILCGMDALAAPLHTRSITIYEGLAGESVYAIYRDADGMTWFGTINGITCYDGYCMTTYDVNKTRSKNAVNGFATTKDGRFFVAASSGLYERDDETGLFVPVKNKSVDKNITDKITAITADGNTLYAGTANGLYIMDGDRVKHIWPNSNHLSRNNMIEDIKVAKDGTVWILSTNELYVLDKRKTHMKPVGLTGNKVAPKDMKRMEIINGRIFLGTYNSGLYCYSIGKRIVYKYLDIGCNVITCLNKYGSMLYAGTDGAGLSVIATKTDDYKRECFCKHG